MKIGILGGGQLSLMLLEASKNLALDIRLFVEKSDEPALKLSRHAQVGSFSDVQSLRLFLREVELVLFESEFVPVERLREAAEGLPLRFIPDLDAMALIQDKLGQKKLLKEVEVPSAKFEVRDEKLDPLVWARKTIEGFGGSCVFKWSRLGYDGKGNLFVRDGKFDEAELKAFIEEPYTRGAKVYAEEMIPFVSELAIIGASSISGERMYYPMVVSKQKDGICLEVKGPASLFGFSAEQEKIAQEYARRISAEALLYGSFGVEFFLLESGEILVNEIAPRVHNTGHYTQDACQTSQFENHLRGVCGMPLGKAHPAKAFAMRNILGPDGISTKDLNPPLPPEKPGLSLHWYGKSEIKPRRKLGHYNGSVDTVEELDELLAKMEEADREWGKALKEYLDGKGK